MHHCISNTEYVLLDSTTKVDAPKKYPENYYDSDSQHALYYPTWIMTPKKTPKVETAVWWGGGGQVNLQGKHTSKCGYILEPTHFTTSLSSIISAHDFSFFLLE